jgi:hypothetical protein
MWTRFVRDEIYQRIAPRHFARDLSRLVARQQPYGHSRKSLVFHRAFRVRYRSTRTRSMRQGCRNTTMAKPHHSVLSARLHPCLNFPATTHCWLQLLGRQSLWRPFSPHKGAELPQSSAATDACGSAFFGSILFSSPKGRTLWPGRHPFWLKSASVSKSTATCQPTATCRPSSKFAFEIRLIWRTLASCGRACFFVV